MEKIDVKQEPYFPFTFKLFAYVLFVFGLLIWTQRDWYFLAKSAGMIASFGIGSMILTARYGLQVDPIARTFHEYVQVLFWKTGNVNSFEKIEKIFINEVTEAATFQTRTGSVHDVKNKSFKAFIKFDNDEKVQLDRDKMKERLEARIAKYRDALEVVE